ncbi:hypothetical protein WA026_009066 [Henosepilachna vigintioctopunctata]|uniref:Uncharacterized protein n=1 Tax=Henosepilachna vigintioctopunctata TaxID=420089 RepID=A0AAW1UXY7_9CUCU
MPLSSANFDSINSPNWQTQYCFLFSMVRNAKGEDIMLELPQIIHKTALAITTVHLAARQSLLEKKAKESPRGRRRTALLGPMLRPSATGYRRNWR